MGPGVACECIETKDGPTIWEDHSYPEIIGPLVILRTPTDVVNAISAQNLILPTGTAKIGSTEYSVGLNASPSSIEGINDIPIRTGPGSTIYNIKDVAHVRDGFQPQPNIVRVDGTRAVLFTMKRAAMHRRSISLRA